MPTTEPVIVPFEGQSKDLEGDIKRLNGEFDKFASHTKTASATASQAGKSATMSWTDFRSMYSTVLDVVRVGQQVWAATGQEYVNYAEQVKNMSRSLGASAEETSRLIQVADDVRVSYDTMKIAMKEAQKDGITPNIEGLAKLSDQYLALAPGVDRTKFLLDKFGKSGLEMGKLMEKGGAGIRAMSDSIDDNLIMTKEGIQASDEYQKSLDDLNDSFLALKISVGEKFVPVMNDSLKVMNANITAFLTFGDVLAGKVKLNDWAAGLINANNIIDDTGAALDDTTGSWEDNTGAIDENSSAVATQKEAVKAAEQALKDYQTQLESVSQANLDMESMSRTIAQEQRQYAQEHAQLEAQKAEATKNGNAEGVAAAQKSIDELQASWHEASQNMIYDMILVGLSAGGLLDSEQKALDEYAVKAGIKTQADIDEANKRREIADGYINSILQSEDVLAEQRKVDAETLRLQEATTSAEKLAASNNEAQAIANVTAHTRQEITEQARLAAAAMRTAAAYHAIPNSGGGGGNYSGSTSGGGGAQRRDSGGAGIAGQPYMIGVKEVYFPDKSGTFVPLGGANAQDVKGIGGVTYNIIINNPVGQSAENDIRKALKMGSKIGRFA